MVKLLISDVDGTLLGKNEQSVSPAIIKQIAALLARGCQVAVASGRTYHSLTGLFRELADRLFFIPCDGALCISNGKTLYHRPIPSEDIRRALTVARNEGLSLLLCSADHGYALGNQAFCEKLKNENTELFTPISSLGEIRSPVYKLAFYGKAPNFRSVPPSLRLAYKADGWCEYVFRYADKGTALSDLQNRLFLSVLDTAAIGDGYNDTAMLKNAKYAYALTDSLAEATGAIRIAAAETALREISANAASSRKSGV